MGKLCQLRSQHPRFLKKLILLLGLLDSFCQVFPFMSEGLMKFYSEAKSHGCSVY